MDYFISSELFEAEGGWEGQERHSEQLVRFDSLSTYFSPPDLATLFAPAPRPYSFEPALSSAGSRPRRVYLCAQTLMKLHPSFDEVITVRRPKGSSQAD